MKNVTISMDEDLAAWARVEAAKEGKSLSRFLADMLVAARGRESVRTQAIERFLSGPLWSVTDDQGRLPTRAELYNERVPGHQSADLRPGPGGSPEADGNPPVDRRTRRA